MWAPSTRSASNRTASMPNSPQPGRTCCPTALSPPLHATRERYSVLPSQLARLLLLQAHSQVSDIEALERSAYVARWAVVLGTQLAHPLCAKSTLQLFRA